MTDCFALLQEPRSVWLDVEALKSRFHQLSAEVHPDRVHDAPPAERKAANARFAELNEAYNVLSSTRLRLKHFIELESGKELEAISQTPSDLMDLFFKCGDLCNGTDRFLREKEEAESPLLKVKFFQQGMEWSDKIQDFIAQVSEHVGKAEAELQADELPDLARLEEIFRRLSYYERWQAQLRERFTRLAM